MSLSEAHHVVFLSTLKSLLENLSLRKLCLVYETWSGMFDNVKDFGDPTDLTTEGLSEPVAGLTDIRDTESSST